MDNGNSRPVFFLTAGSRTGERLLVADPGLSSSRCDLPLVEGWYTLLNWNGPWIGLPGRSPLCVFDVSDTQDGSRLEGTAPSSFS